MARLRPLATRSGLLAALPTIVVVVALAANAVELFHFTDKIWFWADDWDLLFLRGTIPAQDVGLFAPHNSHWFTAHILIYRAIFEIFGLQSFVPYAVVEIAFHIAVAGTTYLLLRRVGSRAWAAVAATLLVAFFGAGANAQIFPATMNHVGSLLFGLLAAYALVRIESRPRAVVVAAVCLVVCVMFSGTGLSLLVLVLLFGVTQRGLLTTGLAVAPPGLAYLAWYLVHADAISSWGGQPDLTQVPSYVWVGLTGTLEGGSGLSGVGPLFLGVLVVCLFVARPEPPALVALAGAGVVADLVQLTLLAVGRFGFGPEQLGTSHYAYINLVLLAPAACLVFDVSLGAIRRSPWAVAALGLVLFSAYSLHGWNQLTKWHNDFALLTSANDDIVMGIRDAYEDGELIVTDATLDDISLDFRASYAVAPAIRDALPDRPADPEWRLEAEGRFFVGVGPDEYGLFQPGQVEVITGLRGRAVVDVDDPGCHELTATAPEPVLEVMVDASQEIVVTSNSTMVKTKLYRGDVEGSLREWPVEPGPVHIATSARDTRLLVAFNGTGTYTVCTP